MTQPHHINGLRKVWYNNTNARECSSLKGLRLAAYADPERVGKEELTFEATNTLT